jgi:hypothetical protein
VRQCHTKSNRDNYRYSYGNTDCYCYADGYGNSHSYSTANTHAADHADPEGAPDSAAQTQSLIPSDW